MHQINVPERQESNNIVKIMKSPICFLWSNIFPNFSKSINRQMQEVSISSFWYCWFKWTDTSILHFSWGKSIYNIGMWHVTHWMNVPERQYSSGEVNICFHCSDIFLNFSKSTNHWKVHDIWEILIWSKTFSIIWNLPLYVIICSKIFVVQSEKDFSNCNWKHKRG